MWSDALRVSEIYTDEWPIGKGSSGVDFHVGRGERGLACIDFHVGIEERGGVIVLGSATCC